MTWLGSSAPGILCRDPAVQFWAGAAVESEDGIWEGLLPGSHSVGWDVVPGRLSAWKQPLGCLSGCLPAVAACPLKASQGGRRLIRRGFRLM